MQQKQPPSTQILVLLVTYWIKLMQMLTNRKKTIKGCKAAPLTLLILIFITAEGDDRFLGSARSLRCHKTVMSGNGGLCLSCKMDGNDLMKQNSLSVQWLEGDPDLSLSCHDLCWSGVCVWPFSHVHLLVSGSPHPSQDSLRSPALVCELQSDAFQIHPPESRWTRGVQVM